MIFTVDAQGLRKQLAMDSSSFLVLQARVSEAFGLREDQYELYYVDIDGQKTLLEDQGDFGQLLSDGVRLVFLNRKEGVELRHAQILEQLQSFL
jgi:hypothetical protein